MKLVGYCRVSTDRQRDEGTIEIQRHALAEYARENGHAIATVFEDNGVSGELENRPGLAAMLDYLESYPEVDGVLIFKLDRLARDVRIQENLLYDLNRRGKKLLSVKEPDLGSNEPDRVLHRHILGAFSQYEKSIISMRLRMGRMRKARKGGYAGGKPSFGYTAKDAELCIDEGQAVTVKAIYGMKRQRHMGLSAIARELYRRGILTAKGGNWYASSVKYILTNPLYRGTVNYSGEKSNRVELAMV